MRVKCSRVLIALLLLLALSSFGTRSDLRAAPKDFAPEVTDPRLKIELFAEAPQIVTPIGMTFDSSGRLLVVESHTHQRPSNYNGPKADRIRMFEDTKGTGRADRVTTFFEGTSATMNIAAYRDGTIYVVTRNEIFRLRDTKHDGVADERTPIAHLDSPGDYPHNGLSGFAFDFHGDVYFGIGENLGAPYKLIGSDGTTLKGGGEGGNIFRCRADGSHLERIATGFWNPFHMCFDTFGRLWAVDNDPDSRPPCRLVNVVQGGDYGYRFRYGRSGLHPFVAWNGELPGTLPMASATGEAPSGVLAYESDGLPVEYRGELLATSWGDHRIDRFTLTDHGATAWAKMTPLVTGGEEFRPVSIVTAPDGSLYATDWVDHSYPVHGRGRIWHISAKDGTKPVRPTDDRELVHSPVRELRENAARRLAADVSKGGREELWRLVPHASDPRTMAAAIAALADTGGKKDENNFDMIALFNFPEDVRAMVVRSMPNEVVTEPLLKALISRKQPAAVRAEALRRDTFATTRAAVLEVLDDPDPFLQQAARQALENMPAELTRIDLDKLPTAKERLGVMLALRAAAEPKGRKWLPKLLDDHDPAIRFAAIEWAGEERIKELRPKIVEILNGQADTREMFEACVAALELIDGTQRPDEFHGEQYVVKALTDAKTSDAMRRLALRMVRPDHPVLTLERLKGFLASKDEPLQIEAVRSLRDSKLPGATEVLAGVATDLKLSANLRAEAIVGLANDPAQHKLLMSLAVGDEQKLRREILDSLEKSQTSAANHETMAHFADMCAETATHTVRQEALRSLRGSQLTEAERETLTKLAKADSATADEVAFLLQPPTPSNPPRHDVDAWIKTLHGPGNSEIYGPGDRAAGERIFYHPRAAGCYRCHQIGGRGGHVGPDLTTAARLLGRRKLIESIVDPSKEIAPRYAPWLLVTKDGKSYTGLLVTEGPGDLETYADSTGKLFILKPADIEERHPLEKSIMPEGLPDLLTTQEFRDLLAFLLRDAK